MKTAMFRIIWSVVLYLLLVLVQSFLLVWILFLCHQVFGVLCANNYTHRL